MHVWLYLMREKAPYNVLYERHLNRIGCFMCPSSDMALIHGIETGYPYLAGLALETRGMAAGKLTAGTWISEGRWRLKEEGSDEEDSNY